MIDIAQMFKFISPIISLKQLASSANFSSHFSMNEIDRKLSNLCLNMLYFLLGS